MKYLFIAIFATGCSLDSTVFTANEEVMSVKDEALQAWNDVGANYHEDFSFAAVSQDELLEVCDNKDDSHLLGCQIYDIVLVEENPRELMLASAIHEIGHLIRNKRGHLVCDNGEQDSMCFHINWTFSPTKRDIEFVLGF